MYLQILSFVLIACGGFAAFKKESLPKKQENPSQNTMLTDAQQSNTYNPSARIHILNTPYDLGFEISFIYWSASQDGMVLAKSGDSFLAVGSYPPPEAVFLVQSFSYNPGFKIGLTYGISEWELQADYTWIRNTTSTHSKAAGNPTFGVQEGATPVWLPNFFTSNVPTPEISSTWNLNIDWLDVTASRPYYQSKKISVAPYAGLRALWIRQSLQLEAKVEPNLGGYGLPPKSVSLNQSCSWGIGPVLGSSAQYLIGMGFRIQADAGASILFTQYTSISSKESNISSDIYSGTSIINTVIKTKLPNYNCVRPLAHLGMGLGWGKYVANNLNNGFFRVGSAHH